MWSRQWYCVTLENIYFIITVLSCNLFGFFQYEYLPSPYSISDNQHCIITNTPDFVNPLQFYPKYSFSACLIECRRDFILQICACKSVFDPGTVCSDLTSIILKIVTWYCVFDLNSFDYFKIRYWTYIYKSSWSRLLVLYFFFFHHDLKLIKIAEIC